MAADYKINLANELTSSEEERTRFYNGMLIYLAACAALIVYTAYFTSMNVKTVIENRAAERRLIATTASVSGLGKRAFEQPGEIYADLEAFSFRIASLKKALALRVQFLPVVHNLFAELPNEVELQSLTATKERLSFGLVMPPNSENARDPSKALRETWEGNEELMGRVLSIRPVTGARRDINGKSMFFVQFECVLKK